MLIKGEVKGERGNIVKHTLFAPHTANVSALVDEVRKYFGWGNIKIYK